MSGKKRRGGKKGLIVVLSVFMVLIVGLVIAIVVVNLNGKSGGQGGGDEGGEIVAGKEWTGDEENEIMSAIQAEIGEMEETEALEHLKKKRAEYKGTSLEFDMFLTEVYYYVGVGRAVEALELAEEIDVDNLSQDDLMAYYRMMKTVCDGLGDPEMADYYYGLYLEIYLEVYEGGLGGE